MPVDTLLGALLWLENRVLDCVLYSEKSSIFRECHILMYKYLGNHPGIWEASVQYTADVDCSVLGWAACQGQSVWTSVLASLKLRC